MIKTKLSDYFRGWFIGNFNPSIYKTEDFEVGVLEHKKGEYWQPHYHKEAVEINVVLSGKMTLNGVEMNVGDIFRIEKNEVARPEFLEDCKILVVKTPSVIGDKYNV
jgi:quercetin dioxygenase-like cupin family protein